jgi:NAD+ synthase (glutamine-hydrolysing)
MVLGESPIVEELKSMAQTKKVGERVIKVININTVAEIKKCHMLFVTVGKSDKHIEVLQKTSGQPILVISEQAGLGAAEALAKNLGMNFLTLPIGAEMESYRKTLGPVFAGRPEDTTEENLQSRIRGNILMALSNKFGWLVLTTGNKSEYSCGYATLYGDMAGGFAVLKDVFKTLVYELARHRNALAAEAPWIPDRTITREPTAELKADQRDTDTLPPYDVLDPILQAYVEEDWEIERIVDRGNDPALVRRVVAMVDRAEYKRRQAPPGIRITARGLGKDRRLPITNGHQPWRD